jgi:hypothetical protein
VTVAGAARTERSIIHGTQHDVECPKIGVGGCRPAASVAAKGYGLVAASFGDIVKG